MTQEIKDVAVFINGRRIFKGVDVEYTSDAVQVKNRGTGALITEYAIKEKAVEFVAEVGKQTAAWDIQSPEGGDEFQRLTVQLGCGCSGMRQYTTDASYSGRFPF